MGAANFVTAFGDEVVQVVDGGLLMVVGSQVKNLGDGAVLPGLQLYLDVGDFLG